MRVISNGSIFVGYFKEGDLHTGKFFGPEGQILGVRKLEGGRR